MPAQQGQTDEILKVTLTSRILGAHWVDDEAASAWEAKVKGLQEGDKVLVSVHMRTDCVMQDGHLFVEGEVPAKEALRIVFQNSLQLRILPQHPSPWSCPTLMRALSL